MTNICKKCNIKADSLFTYNYRLQPGEPQEPNPLCKKCYKETAKHEPPTIKMGV